VKTLTIKNIPDDVLKRFRAYAALSGKSMGDLLIEYMRECGSRVILSDDTETEDKKKAT
jgi:plasmid stability protein